MSKEQTNDEGDAFGRVDHTDVWGGYEMEANDGQRPTREGIPNEETRRVLRESEAGVNVTHFRSAEAFFSDLEQG